MERRWPFRLAIIDPEPWRDSGPTDVAPFTTSDRFPTQLWPVTLYADRYSGGYSGGRWLAASGATTLLDTDAYGQDVAAGEFWHGDEDRSRIGLGETPDLALADLVRRWREAGEPRSFYWDAA